MAEIRRPSEHPRKFSKWNVTQMLFFPSLFRAAGLLRGVVDLLSRTAAQMAAALRDALGFFFRSKSASTAW